MLYYTNWKTLCALNIICSQEFQRISFILKRHFCSSYSLEDCQAAHCSWAGRIVLLFSPCIIKKWPKRVQWGIWQSSLLYFHSHIDTYEILSGLYFPIRGILAWFFRTIGNVTYNKGHVYYLDMKDFMNTQY